MNYYKLPVETETGQCLKALFEKGEECEKAADDFAAAQGACSYLSPEEAEWGGIVAFEFPLNHLVPSHLWDCVDPTDDHPLYVPRIEIKQEPIETSKAQLLAKSASHIVSTTPISFAQIRNQYNRGEAAQMAGITLTTPDPRTLLEQAGLDRKQISMILYGAPIERVASDLPADVVFQLGACLAEDAAISEIMAERSYLMVATISGPRKAKKLFKQMQALPIIPNGSINTVLQIEGNNRPGIILHQASGYFYIKSSHLPMQPDVVPTTEDEFENARIDIVSQSIDNSKLLS